MTQSQPNPRCTRWPLGPVATSPRWKRPPKVLRFSNSCGFWIERVSSGSANSEVRQTGQRQRNSGRPSSACQGSQTRDPLQGHQRRGTCHVRRPNPRLYLWWPKPTNQPIYSFVCFCIFVICCLAIISFCFFLRGDSC